MFSNQDKFVINAFRSDMDVTVFSTARRRGDSSASLMIRLALASACKLITGARHCRDQD